MRLASVSDQWRRVYKRNYDIAIKVLEYNNVLGLGTGTIEFHGGITAICGANGVGKTTLLNALLSVLSPENILISNAPMLRLDGSSLKGSLISKGVITQRTVNFSKDGLESTPQDFGDFEVIWIDSSFQSPRLVSLFTDMKNLTELLEAIEQRVSTPNELKELSYIIGKEYDNCETFEIEDIGGLDVLPYFKVQSSGKTYGIETMGLGEVAIHYIIWQLYRASKNSIILLEEPEAYLAPKSQEALINIIAKLSQEKGISVILTTHSPEVLKRIPIEHVRLLARVGPSVRIITPDYKSEYLTTLGINTNKSGVILVEDRFAREFTKSWVGKHDPHFLQEYEIISVGSDNKIVSLLKDIPYMNWFRVLGLLDGDRHELKEVYNWPYTFLPGLCPPEKLLKDVALVNIEELALVLKREVNAVHRILSTLEGANHHDWFEEFHKGIGMTYEQLMASLVDLWYAYEDNNIVSEELFNNLNIKLNRENLNEPLIKTS
ncbi:ATP-dependent endonuclease [Paenibacillus chitinolyticus]|uniref:ATP-dependent nuclease n=1 Tax=Paenibacillus chitinolyticus TaxID=79263 RepID=UPI0036D89DB3